MADIYEQYRNAFSQVEAYVVLSGDKVVANVTFKFPRDGGSRLYAYMHWFGSDLVRGHASGGGYNKRSAAVEHALGKITPEVNEALFENFKNGILNEESGKAWYNRLGDAGFRVIQAV